MQFRIILCKFKSGPPLLKSSGAPTPVTQYEQSRVVSVFISCHPPAALQSHSLLLLKGLRPKPAPGPLLGYTQCLGHSSPGSPPMDSLACFKSLSRCHLLRDLFSPPCSMLQTTPSHRGSLVTKMATKVCPSLPHIHVFCNVTFQLLPLRDSHWNAAEITQASQSRPCVHLLSPNPASAMRPSLGWPAGE